MGLLITIASLICTFLLGFYSGYGAINKALKNKYIGSAYFVVNELKNYEQLASAKGVPVKVKRRALKRLRRKARELFSRKEWANDENLQMRR